MTQNTLTTDRLLDRLRQECREAGSQRKWAMAHGFSPAFVSDVLTGRRDVTDKLAAALGYVRSVWWMKETDAA